MTPPPPPWAPNAEVAPGRLMGWYTAEAPLSFEDQLRQWDDVDCIDENGNSDVEAKIQMISRMRVIVGQYDPQRGWLRPGNGSDGYKLIKVVV